MSFWFRRWMEQSRSPKVDNVALGVAEDLELDVVRVLDEFLDVNPAVAERFFGLAAGGVVALNQRDVVVGRAHPASATAGHGLDHHGVADFLGDLERLLLGLDDVLEPGGTGTPALRANSRLRALSSSAFIAADFGPMKRMLQFSQTSAKWAFSERNP